MQKEANPVSDFPYWALDNDHILSKLNASLNGLTSIQAQQRLEEFGRNSLQGKSKVTPLKMFLGQFKSPIILILIFATLVSAFVQDWVDATIILGIVFASALLSFIQEYSANTAAEKLRAQIHVTTRVIRDGKEQIIPNEEVVIGDIVLLSGGNLVPADGIVLEGNDFFVNEAVLTGETYPVEKKPGKVEPNAALHERTNCVFMGTSVRSGTAKVLITETGARTFFGQIAKRLTLRTPETEFERGVRRLGYLLTEVMFILVVGIFALNVFFHKPVLDSLLFSLALAVGLTPQLLPAIININLSKGSQTMAKQDVIVRRLSSIENFGSMDILCTDKTGTLTEGVIRLDHAYDVQGQDSERVKRAAWLNAHFQNGMVNPLDEAIVTTIQDEEKAAKKIAEIPYDFVRKRLTIVVEENGDITMISKGAYLKVLEVCSSIEIDGEIQNLSETWQEKLQEMYSKWSEQGYRVLGIVQRVVPQQSNYGRDDEHSMVFLGFLLFFDPPKKGVLETIQKLEEMGVHIKIITGDNKLVARHTALAIGIENPLILSGDEMNNLGDEALWHMAEKINIFADVDPNEKERIILALKKTGHVVGYMGDGINDAPSLHSADVGISVANAVDVAKESADFVLLKHDLAVLERGIREGRKTFANTLKYVFMATSANFGNMFSVAGASLFLPFLPLLPTQILLINFLTDFPEMTIATDNVDPIYVEKPHRWNIHFIRRFMLVFGPLSSVFDYLTFGLMLFVVRAHEATFQSGWFVESVLSAALVVFTLRTRLPIFHSRPSRWMLLATAMVGVVTLLIPYTSLGKLFNFKPLPPIALIGIFVIVLFYITTAELTKRWFFRRYDI
ncbi:MAG: magnesium-translocating P-type ATPase [Anaerolineales bacterium]